jgi:hypothetical protein
MVMVWVQEPRGRLSEWPERIRGPKRTRTGQRLVRAKLLKAWQLAAMEKLGMLRSDFLAIRDELRNWLISAC